jgi:hypothetical protein
MRWVAGTPVISHVLSGGGWRDVYGIGHDGAVLVRPDGVVAWRSSGAGDPAGVRTVLSDHLRYVAMDDQMNCPSGARMSM